MNSLELQSWMLRNLQPLKESALDDQAANIMAIDPDERAAFYRATGRFEGLHEATTLLLELVEQLYADERRETGLPVASVPAPAGDREPVHP